MNLGLRDAADLAAVLEDHRDDPGAPAALAAYDRRRRLDIMARAGAVNMLNLSLLSSFLPAQMLRSLGLSAISRVAPLRAFFMREGMRPGSGFSGLFGAIREKGREAAGRS
jgi:2-octaprenyl-6-methoxyphenol hydroxylase